MSVLLGKGDGTFQDVQSFDAGTFPFAVAAADFNGDGSVDVAVADRISGTVEVLLGKWLGFWLILMVYLLLMAGGILLIAWAIARPSPRDAPVTRMILP